MNNKVILVRGPGEVKTVSLDNDIVMIILAVFGVAWIKLFIDGRVTSGVINILLMYTIIGSLIHGIYLGLKPEKYVQELLSQGYKAASPEDEEKIKFYLGY